MHKIRKRARKLPHAGKAKRFPPRVTFLAGGDFRARSNIPEENEGLLVVVDLVPGYRARVAIFPLAQLSLRKIRDCL